MEKLGGESRREAKQCENINITSNVTIGHCHRKYTVEKSREVN